MRVRFLVAGFIVAATLLVAGWAVTRAAAQAVAIERVPPRIMTSPDVGFRVEGLRGGKPVGTIVVQVNGQWVAAEIAPPNLTTPLSQR